MTTLREKKRAGKSAVKRNHRAIERCFRPFRKGKFSPAAGVRYRKCVIRANAKFANVMRRIYKATK